MIDEKKLIEALKKEISETYHDDYVLALERAIEIVKEQDKHAFIPIPEANSKLKAHAGFFEIK